ncbi:MAG TPA: methyltransferase domain-containing protein [Candidatus Avisuccinivibrio pullicola]|nr:methyltransferase domain-containing protein [Candidatus Avisuccinivibrio pullicola]
MSDHARIAGRFFAARHSYVREAVVQEDMAQSLLTALKESGADPARTLELGCGAGLLSLRLCTLPGITLTLNDLSPALSAHTARVLKDRYPELELTLQPGDMESLTLNGPYTLIAANAVLQWARDLPSLLKTLHSGLAPGGTLAFTTFVTPTLMALPAAGVKGLDYYTPEALTRLVQEIFPVSALSFKDYALHFVSAREALMHLKATGTNAVGEGVLSVPATRRLLHRLEQNMENGKVTLHFNTARVLCRA